MNSLAATIGRLLPGGTTAGADPAETADLDFATRLARATQQVRIQQSQRTMPLVAVGAIAFMITYWTEAPGAGIVVWVLLVMAATLVRWSVVRTIRPRLETAELPELQEFEQQLFVTALINAVAIGSGFWWVGLGGSQAAAYAVTLLCSIYAIGSMINASVQYQSFAPTVVVNLGQGVVFSLGLGLWEPLIAVSLVIIMVLQLGFGRFNANQFAESIRIRTENSRLVAQLQKEKRAVEQALAAASAANDSKSHFLAAASHDLRQPLHALSLYLGSLELQLTEAQDRDLLKRITDATEMLRRQFDGLLDLSQFDAHGVQPEISEFRLHPLLERLAKEFEQDARAKHLSLTLAADPCIVRSDPLQLERLLRNLLENAIRYTQQGGVTLSARRGVDSVRVAVEDTGPGISADNQSRVFQDFVQLDNRARQRDKGVGLGLAIVRRINELLGLQLQLSSEEGMGTRFQFELPFVADVAQTEEKPAATDGPAPGIATGTTVWAIDDDAVVREALRTQLEGWGCSVSTAASLSTLQPVAADPAACPDLVLIDDMLGTEESGLDIARCFAARMPAERIALITGNTEPARLKELRDSGFTVLLKPTRTHQLWHLVRRCAATPTN